MVKQKSVCRKGNTYWHRVCHIFPKIDHHPHFALFSSLQNGRTSCRLAAGAPMFAIRRPCLVDLFAICATFAGEPRQTQRLTCVPCVCTLNCSADVRLTGLSKTEPKIAGKRWKWKEKWRKTAPSFSPSWVQDAARHRRLNVQINVHTNYTTILKIGLFVGLCVYFLCLRWLGAICVHWLATCVSLIVPQTSVSGISTTNLKQRDRTEWAEWLCLYSKFGATLVNCKLILGHCADFTVACLVN